MAKQTAAERAAIYLSFVAPAHNEAESLPALVKEVAAVGEGLGRPWEFVVVDDGSEDGSLELLRGLMADLPQLRVVWVARRYGKAAALEAGFRATRGRFIAMLDADGQNDPAEVPRMLEPVAAGECDMVTGWRKDRRDPWLRRVSTKIANGVRNRLTRETIRDSASGLKVFQREVAERFKLFEGLHRFLPTLAKMNGFRVVEIPVRHRPRVAGRAKYGLWNRIFRALRDTFAVRWMQRRNLVYDAKELERDDVTGTSRQG